jgi:phage FluMu protein Com
MQQVKEKLAYLKGLAEGLNVGQGTSEGRVLVGLMEAMHDMARAVERLQTQQYYLEEYVEAIDDDLTDLEDDLYEEYEVEDLDFDDEYDDDLEFGDDDDTAIEYMEMTCPRCDETVFVDEDVFDNDEVVEVICPECNETVLVNDASGGDLD